MLARYLPLVGWLKRYDKHTLSSELLAALIVTIMLISQSLTYAMLAAKGRLIRQYFIATGLHTVWHQPHLIRGSDRNLGSSCLMDQCLMDV